MLSNSNLKNYNLLKSDTEAYMAYGPALTGVFNVAIDGDEITINVEGDEQKLIDYLQ